MNQTPSIGRTIHVVLPEEIGGVKINPSSVGQHRPAVIVRTWDGVEPGSVAPYVNVQIFVDGHNDVEQARLPSESIWATSVCYNEARTLGTWHWPEQA